MTNKTVNYGVVVVSVTDKGFPISKVQGKLPVTEIPAGSVLNSAVMKIVDPFKIIGSSSNPVSLALGTYEDDDLFIPWFTPADLVDEVETVCNGGGYFNNPFRFNAETIVYLSYGFLNSCFSVGPSLLANDSCSSSVGNGYVAFYVHGRTTNTEYFDGLAWAYGPDVLISAHDGFSVGEVAGCLTVGGSTDNGETPHNKCQFFNGTAWTMFPNYPVNVFGHDGVGTADDALMFGSLVQADMRFCTVFNGIAWSQTASLNQGRYETAPFGTPSRAVGAGGGLADGTPTSSVEEYNGIVWYFIASLPATRSSGCGLGLTASCGMSIMGFSPSLDYCWNNSFIYREPVWMDGPRTSQARAEPSSSGNERVAVIAAGDYKSGNSIILVNTVDLLRPDVLSVTGHVDLVFVLS
ncbi:MAG: hypothetical protein QW835_00175 [Candidatus Hadarchaeum sp.]